MSDHDSRVRGLRADAYDALREAEDRYRLAAKATDDIIWDYELGGRTVHWNEALTRRFGHAPEALTTSIEWWEERLHPEDRARVVGSINAAIESTSDYWSEEYRFEVAGGGYADVLDRGYIIRDKTGRGTRMVGAILDLSERRRTETALRESEENYRYTVELSPQLAWTADPDGSNIDFKRPFYDFPGLPDAQEAESWIDQHTHPEDRAYRRREWEISLRSGRPLDAEFRFRRANGDYRWVRSRSWPRRDETGQIIRWYGVTEDVHDHKVAEQQLQRLQHELSQVARVSAMGTLATALAHELNQPLAAITNYMAGSKRLLANHGAGALPVLAEALEGAGKAAIQAGEIVRRMRDLVGKGEVRRQPVDLGALIHEVCRLSLGELRDRAVGLSLELGTGARTVLADRIQLQQVFTNLLHNAAEAMEGAPRRVVTITVAPHDAERLVVRIEDSGPGLPPEVRRHLFSPFVSTKVTGMGVGLSICRSIIEAHGGQLWAEDAPGGGAVFCFTLQTT